MGGNVVGDYIEVTGVERGTDLVAEILRLLPEPVALREGHGRFPLIDLDGVEVLVDECGDDRAVLAIGGDAVQTGRRRAGARQVFETLAEATDWSLCWTADGSEGPVGSRTADEPIGLRPRRLVLVSSEAAAS